MIRTVLKRGGDDQGSEGLNLEIGEVHLIEGASYVFLDFQTIEHATRALSLLNGQKVNDMDGSSKGSLSQPLDGIGGGVRKQRVLVATFAERHMPVAESPDFVDSCSSLFDAEPRPPGMALVQDFLSADKEAALLAVIDGGPWDSRTLARRVQHFGYTFNYGLRGIDFAADTPPLPAAFQELVARMVEEGVVPASLEPNQCTVNEYLPGQGIARHVDTHSAFDDALVSLSLRAPVAMDFRKQHFGGGDKGGATVEKSSGQKQGVQIRQTELFPQSTSASPNSASITGVAGAVHVYDSGPPPRCDALKTIAATSLRAEEGESVDHTQQQQQQQQHEEEVTGHLQAPVPLERSLVWLQPRSLLLLQGDARYRWSHAIAPRKLDRVDGTLVRRTETRVSLTFRKVLFPKNEFSMSSSGRRGGDDSDDGVRTAQLVNWRCPCGGAFCTA
jgi:alkylated DNA repair dioxygenase AlkB